MQTEKKIRTKEKYAIRRVLKIGKYANMEKNREVKSNIIQIAIFVFSSVLCIRFFVMNVCVLTWTALICNFNEFSCLRAWIVVHCSRWCQKFTMSLLLASFHYNLQQRILKMRRKKKLKKYRINFESSAQGEGRKTKKNPTGCWKKKK